MVGGDAETFRRAEPLMRAGGSIMSLTYGASRQVIPNYNAMAIAKAALEAITMYLAADLGRHGIRVNTVRLGWIGGAPVWGYIDAQVASGRPREEVVGEITARIPLGIIPPEEDCAKAVLFLASDYAKVVSGAALDVNGGQYMPP